MLRSSSGVRCRTNTLMQSRPPQSPWAVPTTPGRDISASVCFFRTASIIISGIPFPFGLRAGREEKQPIAITALTSRPHLAVRARPLNRPDDLPPPLPELNYSPSMVTPNAFSTTPIWLAIAYLPLEVPAKSRPTGLRPGSVTNREPESPALINGLLP